MLLDGPQHVYEAVLSRRPRLCKPAKSRRFPGGQAFSCLAARRSCCFGKPHWERKAEQSDGLTRCLRTTRRRMEVCAGAESNVTASSRQVVGTNSFIFFNSSFLPKLVEPALRTPAITDQRTMSAGKAWWPAFVKGVRCRSPSQTRTDACKRIWPALGKPRRRKPRDLLLSSTCATGYGDLNGAGDRITVDHVIDLVL